VRRFARRASFSVKVDLFHKRANTFEILLMMGIFGSVILKRGDKKDLFQIVYFNK
jgi:hypothetical protein